MYVNIPENTKCSKCGAENNSERVERHHETFRRCRTCGHEKLIWTTKATNTGPVYVLKHSEPEIF
jgi:uncharacterized Zn finger protein